MYAVIDTETTGLSPRDDRIIELAVIGLDARGDKEWEWCSLINPERDTGHGLAVKVHQIYPKDVERAPTFDSVAGIVAEMLGGRALIAHNAQFDLALLNAEFGRLNVRLPEMPRVCTATVAREAGFRPYRLGDCCDALGIEYSGAHHALADARATADLAQRLLDFSDHAFRHSVETRIRDAGDWPRFPKRRIKPVRRPIPPVRSRKQATAGSDSAKVAAERVASGKTEPVIESVQVDRTTPETRYLSAVEWVLEDREIPMEQKKALEDLRAELELSDEQVHETHLQFLRGLAGSMLSDGVISHHEQFDLDLVGELLGLNADDVEYARDHPIGLELVNESYKLQPGMRVVFTGEMSIPRSEWKQRAEAAGLKVTGSVSSKTDLLVVPFGETGSSKSRNARMLGVGVVSEQRFRRMLRASCLSALE